MYKLLLLFIITFSSYTQASIYSERDEVKNFVNYMVQKHGFEQKHTLSLFENISPSAEVIKKVSAPFESVTWHQYKNLFLSKQRINDGIKFWQENKQELQRAEKEFGVSSEIIVAIIGVESFYGKHLGNFPVLQSVSTLAFDYPKRAKFFLGELEHLLLLTKEKNIDIKALYGSYAGAMGSPQFIASSYRNYAIDFANSGKVDLNNMTNAIGSVANYFKKHGWQENQPVVHQAKVNGDKYKALLTKDEKAPKPTIELDILANNGVTPIKPIAIFNKNHKNIKLSLLELSGKNKIEHWLGRDNFYVITRYNHSTNYAMAVYQLSQEIYKRYKTNA